MTAHIFFFFKALCMAKPLRKVKGPWPTGKNICNLYHHKESMSLICKELPDVDKDEKNNYLTEKSTKTF